MQPTTSQHQVKSTTPQVYVEEVWNQRQAADGPGGCTSNLGPGRGAKECCGGCVVFGPGRPTTVEKGIAGGCLHAV